MLPNFEYYSGETGETRVTKGKPKIRKLPGIPSDGETNEILLSRTRAESLFTHSRSTRRSFFLLETELCTTYPMLSFLWLYLSELLLIHYDIFYTNPPTLI